MLWFHLICTFIYSLEGACTRLQNFPSPRLLSNNARDGHYEEATHRYESQREEDGGVVVTEVVRDASVFVVRVRGGVWFPIHFNPESASILGGKCGGNGTLLKLRVGSVSNLAPCHCLNSMLDTWTMPAESNSRCQKVKQHVLLFRWWCRCTPRSYLVGRLWFSVVVIVIIHLFADFLRKGDAVLGSHSEPFSSIIHFLDLCQSPSCGCTQFGALREIDGLNKILVSYKQAKIREPYLCLISWAFLQPDIQLLTEEWRLLSDLYFGEDASKVYFGEDT